MASVTVESGTGLKGDGTPEDPTAGYSSERFGLITIGTQDGPNAFGGYIAVGRESTGNVLAGKVGVQVQAQAGVVQIYAEDYTHKNPKANVVEDVNDATGCALLGTYEGGTCGTVGEDDNPNDAFLITIKP